MSIDDTVLLAYVDGELSAERGSEVEAAAAHSPELAGRLAAMRASVLPYGAAFERQALAPLPETLTKRIEELTRVSANSHDPVLRRPSSWPRLAAAFLVGALVSGAILRLPLAETPFTTHIAPISPWVTAVADYQMLYTRETVADITEDPALSEKVIGDVRRADRLPVSVPDLRSAGLVFKRVQRLSFHDRPVVQMVYLPEQGGPVALCVTRDASPDEAPHSQQVGEMNAVVWRHDRIGYLLLGKGSQVNLAELGRRIAAGNTTSLFGRTAQPEHRDGAAVSELPG